MARPTEGMEEEFNAWYQHRHLPDVTAVAGFKSAQRFKLTKVMSSHEAYPYLSIYDIETDDIEAALKDMKSRARTERMPISKALAPGSFGVVYEEAGPAVFALEI
jgi:hypothetical protein